jgi:hypothetical protein
LVFRCLLYKEIEKNVNLNFTIHKTDLKYAMFSQI